jgi:hypothetical protein
MSSYLTSLLKSYDEVWNRLAVRLDGLSDEEYFWEPVAHCWSLRHGDDGLWHLDEGGEDDPASPAPFTTIAWRLGHIGAVCLGGFTRLRFASDGESTEVGLAPSVAVLSQVINGQYLHWREHLEGLGVIEWEAPLGPAWGPYADDTTFDLALHVLDEVTHHAGEVGVLRDLYAHRMP